MSPLDVTCPTCRAPRGVACAEPGHADRDEASRNWIPPESGVRLAVGLSEHAWLEEVATKRDRVIRFLSVRYRMQPAEAEDVAQDALLWSWRYRHTFGLLPRATPWSWLRMIACQRAMKAWGKSSKGNAASLDEVAPALVSVDFPAEDAIDTRRMLATIEDVDAFIDAVDRERLSASLRASAYSLPVDIVARAAGLVRSGVPLFRVVQVLGPVGQHGKNVSRTGLRDALKKHHPELTWSTKGGRPKRAA